MKDGDVSLILKDVTINDAGTYGCRAVMQEIFSWWLIRTIYLHVVPPDQKNITAESGQDVTLTCRAPNNKFIGVEWSRADLGDEYLLLYRNGQYVPYYQHPSFKNRVDLQDRQMKDGDVSLILKDVAIKDAGTYKCRVYMTETDSWQLISIIYLHVVPPDQKNITAESGQDVTLTCRAPNNIRVARWSRADLEYKNVLLYGDNQFFPANQHPSFKNRVDLQERQMKDGDMSLILKDVTMNDAGTYECRVYMEQILSWKIISIIYLHVDPPDQEMITAESGQDVTLTCRAPNKKIIVLRWSRADLEPKYVLSYWNGHFDPDHQHPSFKNRVDLQDRQMKDGDVSLILKNVTINDAGTFGCRVFMAETDSWQLISIISLSVVPPVQKTITAVPGQNVTLTCRAANNNIRAVKWSRADLGDEHVLLYRDGHFVTVYQHPSFRYRVDLQDRQMKDGDVSLILKNVMINDAGTYECRVYMAETRLLKPISIITLKVLPPDQKTITAESGQDVTLTCRALNKIIVLRWSRADLGDEYVLLYRNGRFDPGNQHPSFKNRVDLQDRHMKDGDVSLILKDVTINDAGTYECRVVQGQGLEIISSIYLHVVPPEQKTITAESGQDVTLTCRVPQGKPIRAVKWSRADLGDNDVLFYRDEQLDPDDQHPSFMYRVDLQDRQMKDGDVSLILKDVTINDAGTYECIVFMAETHSWKYINTTYLHVVPPGQPGGHRVDGSVGLLIGLNVFAVFLVAVVIVFVIYRKYERENGDFNSY
ncbi:hemicentin-1-like isoform X2 [Oreochromis aureus]|nr:hemicentin-1-like isoform X2 [Oreochromis aureus]XP_039464598.1 hemicentin-1-like isoform X2 [Oreochromis aureus]